ncbi:MAG TPA: 2'-5' RNA ligase family protein, partial [Methylomirabilota bacterium]|nr:2'-5' RNA ligase family protein [Methylomirabilota bacterium]
MIRSFVAILLPDDLRESIAATIEMLRPLGTAVAWVPPQNLHVTLQFLGNQTEDRLAEAAAALDEAGAGCGPLDV